MAPISSFLAPLVAAAAFLAPLANAAPQPQLFRDGKFLGVPVSNAEALNVIPNSFIVVYNKTASQADVEASQASIMATIAKRNIGKRSLDGRDLSTSVRTCSVGTWRAMMLDADDKTILDIMKDPTVSYVENDAKVQLNLPQGPVAEEADGEMHALPVRSAYTRRMLGKRAATVQSGAPNGLARLSRSEPNTATSGTYTFDDTAGAGITVYVVDTGIRTTHSEFAGRATFGANFINNVDEDENGHGSHVAGTIAGSTFGVAKKANVVAVKVLDAQGGGSNAGVISGMNFVASDATSKNRSRKAVMNMSLGGSTSRAVNEAINAIRRAGVVPVVAAGNENQDARNSSPASATGAITVGAIDQRTDRRASFSNFGTAVDIFGPGVNVLSVDATNDTGSKTLSGTSMASPHIAGLAAYLMALNTTLTSGGTLDKVADAVDAQIKSLATAQNARVGGTLPAGTTNLIANNGNV